ncbi:MAG: YjjW family glycine radical enzyme activase [Oscillospiraceae bacterium]|nr:YjjW family glycine radical enzyme activase [Oscillospiraceae bacterium]
MMRAPVAKIIPFSNVDGPGNRTSVFFQGCTFNCLFCHNPETIHLCKSCGICVEKCPAGALSFDASGTVVWNSTACVGCDSCIHVCPHDSSPRVRWLTVEDLMKEIRRSAPYIDGITTSGGECTLQNEFLIELFTEVRKLGKTCLIDSNGSFDFEADPRILTVSEGVMLDVKAADGAWSNILISHTQELVLKNLDYLLSVNKLHEVRTVIFPGRDTENAEAVRTVAGHIGSACPYKIIRYRPFGVRERYQKLLGEFETETEYAERFARLARECGAAKAFVV